MNYTVNDDMSKLDKEKQVIKRKHNQRNYLEFHKFFKEVDENDKFHSFNTMESKRH